VWTSRRGSCRTSLSDFAAGRRPDVSYLTVELLETVEIRFSTDSAEELFAKAQEYLESGCEEVWLVFPESRRVLVLTPESDIGV